MFCTRGSILKLFSLKPTIYKYETFKEFVDEYQITEDDFILTHEAIYNKFIEPLGIRAEAIFKGDYGGEPSDEMIEKIVANQKKDNYIRIFAIGGGSVIDIGKILALKDCNKPTDLFEGKIPSTKNKELIAVPATCGTGSEVTNVSIAEIKSKQIKLGLANDNLLPDDAVLISELSTILPYNFFVFSSIDALIHAIESFVSPKANPFTEMYSIKATEIILKGYLEIIENGEEYRNKIMDEFLLASNYAGIAFGNAGVGAVHAMSYPLSGKYHVPHGEANYQFFTEVFKTYSRKNPTGKIKHLNVLIGDILNLDEDDNIYDELEDILSKLISKNKLREYGMKEEKIELFTDSVIKEQQRLLVNNYVPLTREDILNIYKNLY